ncbi:CapA family protein, partial [Mesorhizobium sp. M00.F.Ca.ET.186.01.1.1]
LPICFRVVPIRSYLRHPDIHLPLMQRKKLRLMWERAVRIIGRKPGILIE